MSYKSPKLHEFGPIIISSKDEVNTDWDPEGKPFHLRTPHLSDQI
jgi:hypothetical protein